MTSGNMYGGVETFLATLAREAVAVPDMQPEFAVCFEGRSSQELGSLGHPPHLLGGVRLSRPYSVLRARRTLETLLNRSSFDVVVCHQPWPYVVFGSVARRHGLPVVLWVHMAGDGRHWLERLARYRTPDLAVCNSRFSAQRLSEWMSCPRVEHVYCPVSASPGPIGSRAAIRHALATPESDVVVIQVSRLESWKGQHVLLEALSRLRELPGWTCWIAGGAQRSSEASYRRQLENLANDRGIADRVRLLGDRNDVPELLLAADVFCQPNTSPEPFGLALVEAMRAGLPVVTSRMGGACEIVDHTCGVLTPAGDAASLADALKRLIVDAHTRKVLSAAARRRPDVICDVSQQMRRIHDVLSSVTAA